MNFSELVFLLGKRIVAPEVIAFATSHGVKLPLKPSTDGDSSGHFSIKKLNLEVRWSHDIALPDYYPPKKENQIYVCYISTIWFDALKVTGLPEIDNALVGVPQLLPGFANISLTTNNSGDRFMLSLNEHRRYEFLKSGARSHAFTPWDPAWPPEQADLPISMWMAWVIHRGFMGERHLRDHADAVEAVRQRKQTGREFLYQVAFCNELWSWDVSPVLHRFAHRYIHCLCHRNSSQPLLGLADRCGPDDDFMAVFNPHFSNRGLSAADDWCNFDRFALFLDARYADFQLTGLVTDIDAETLKRVKLIYLKAQKAMADLPRPIALATPGNADH
jgi:hypothetical protein